MNAAFNVLVRILAGCLRFSSHHVRPSTDSSLISSHNRRDPAVTESKHSSYTHETEGGKKTPNPNRNRMWSRSASPLGHERPFALDIFMRWSGILSCFKADMLSTRDIKIGQRKATVCSEIPTVVDKTMTPNETPWAEMQCVLCVWLPLPFTCTNPYKPSSPPPP